MLILILSLLYLLMVYLVLRVFAFAAKSDNIRFEYEKEHKLSSW